MGVAAHSLLYRQYPFQVAAETESEDSLREKILNSVPSRAAFRHFAEPRSIEAIVTSFMLMKDKRYRLSSSEVPLGRRRRCNSMRPYFLRVTSLLNHRQKRLSLELSRRYSAISPSDGQSLKVALVSEVALALILSKASKNTVKHISRLLIECLLENCSEDGGFISRSLNAPTIYCTSVGVMALRAVIKYGDLDVEQRQISDNLLRGALGFLSSGTLGSFGTFRKSDRARLHPTIWANAALSGPGHKNRSTTKLATSPIWSQAMQLLNELPASAWLEAPRELGEQSILIERWVKKNRPDLERVFELSMSDKVTLVEAEVFTLSSEERRVYGIEQLPWNHCSGALATILLSTAARHDSNFLSGSFRLIDRLTRVKATEVKDFELSHAILAVQHTIDTIRWWYEQNIEF